MLVDAHCHLDSYKTILIPENILPITTGYSHTSNLKNLDIAKKYKIPFVLGVAPQTAQKQGIKDLDLWIEFIRKNKPWAVGEIGLDNHWAETPEHKTNQMKVFERMVELAEELKLPLVIHSRDAEAEVINYLSEIKFKFGIMMHFYSGDEVTAKKVVDLGGLISVPPVRSKKRKIVIKDTPLDNLVIETDSPYVGRTLESVVDSLNYIVEVKQVDAAEVEKKTTENILSLLKYNR